jgi:hypothetical protein
VNALDGEWTIVVVVLQHADRSEVFVDERRHAAADVGSDPGYADLEECTQPELHKGGAGSAHVDATTPRCGQGAGINAGPCAA